MTPPYDPVKFQFIGLLDKADKHIMNIVLRTENARCFYTAGIFWFGKKRGRKEDLWSPKGGGSRLPPPFLVTE